MAGTVALSAAALAAAMGGRLRGGDYAPQPTGYSIDSRTLQPGDLFFAIVAARDGHDFVADAIARGAAGVVVSRSDVVIRDDDKVVVVEVADTTRALQDLGRYVRSESGATVIAITGSVGKTTTKDVVAEMLGARYQVVKNKGNLNNHLGLPLSLLELRHGAEVAVMELGMNHAGEIRKLMEIAQPNIRVWTNVSEAHIGHFGSVDRIADAKAEILDAATPESVLVANADDPRVMQRSRHFPGRRVTYGEAAVADIRAIDIENLGLDGTRLRIVTPLQTIPVQVPLMGRGHLSNVLAATTVAVGMGIPLTDISSRIEGLKPSPHRGAVIHLSNRVIVVDDSYNSSPAGLKRALQTLAGIRASRRVAVLGEMLELGELSTRLHRDCGHVAANSKLGLLFTIGGASAQALGEAAIDAGFPRSCVTHYETSEEAAPQVTLRVSDGDVVLIKGSRGTRTDRVVDLLQAAFR